MNEINLIYRQNFHMTGFLKFQAEATFTIKLEKFLQHSVCCKIVNRLLETLFNKNIAVKR